MAAQRPDVGAAAALDHGRAADIVRAGTSGCVIRIAPPLTVSDEEFDEGLHLLDQAITATT